MDIIIVVDCGALKAFTISKGEKTKTAHLVEEIVIDEDRGRYSDKVTDQASRFRNWGASGERTTVELEKELKALRHLVKEIELLLKKYQPSQWGFAAPSEINNAILNELNASFKESLGLNLKKDLTNVPAAKLLSHFSK